MAGLTINVTNPIFLPSGTLLAVDWTGGTTQSVAVTGGYTTGTPTDIEFEWTGSGGSGFTALGATIGGGNWSATLPNLPTVAGGQTFANSILTLRWANDHSKSVAITLWIGVGIGICGDSTVDNPGSLEALSITTGVPVHVWDDGSGTWVNILDGNTTMWARYFEQLRAQIGMPIFTIKLGGAGMNLADWKVTGSYPYSSFKTAYTNSKLTKLQRIYLQLGSNSVRNPTPSSATYRADGATFNTSALADFGTPVTSVMHMLIADKGEGGLWGGDLAAHRDALDLHRQGVLDGYSDGTWKRGGNLTGQLYAGDHTHPDTVALGREISQRSFLATATDFYGGTAASPRMTNVRTNHAKTDHLIDFDAAFSNTLNADVDGFRVENGSSVAQTILTAKVTRLVPTGQVTVTTGAVSGQPKVSFASGEDAVGGTLPQSVAFALPDTSLVASITLPPEPFFDIVAATDSPSSSQSASASPSQSSSTSVSASSSQSPSHSSSVSSSTSPSHSPSASPSGSSSPSASTSTSGSASPSQSSSTSVSPSSTPSSSSSPSSTSSLSESASSSLSESRSASPSPSLPDATPEVTVIC